jgi:hypothetical protein
VFQVYVVMGSDANDSARQEAVDALNSIVVAHGFSARCVGSIGPRSGEAWTA